MRHSCASFSTRQRQHLEHNPIHYSGRPNIPLQYRKLFLILYRFLSTFDRLKKNTEAVQPLFQLPVMKIPLVLLFAFLCAIPARSQEIIDPQKIDIVRDRWGVPHIFAKTDAEVAYGLAYAHAEDDFKTIQTSFIAAKRMLGRLNGKSGATIDYVGWLIRARELVAAKYATDISPAYRAVLTGYCAGFNAYARTHPGEVLLKRLFPIVPEDILAFSVLQLFIACGGDTALAAIFGGTVPALPQFQPGGSNAYAFNSRATADGSVMLAINSHQPLDGPVSWYEAHLCSEEGWNILGALFPGSPSILLGCNEYLGWGHTVNNPDKLDVFQLKINPKNKLQYEMDGRWVDLEVSKARLRIKGVPIGIGRKVYWSQYGPTAITKKGTFSVRTAPLFDIRALEQWYKMNKARNFSEFYRALKMEAMPGYNTIYGDKYDTIFYISNGRLPLRPGSFNWRRTVPGNLSQTRWTQYHPLEQLPQQLNPASGYLFNSNHSPFNASAPADNLKATAYDPAMGFETHDNNRSRRFMELIGQAPKLTYEDFKRIKYDRTLPKQLAYNINPDTLFVLPAGEFPALAPLIATLKSWDKTANASSQGAAIFAMAYYYVADRSQKDWAGTRKLTKAQCVAVYEHIAQYQQTHFGKTGVTLGEYQQLVRGTKAIPLPGLPDVIASMEAEPHQNGRVKGRQGESYIELVRFTQNGPQIETINTYGASNRPDSPHYADQMEWFTSQKTKKMTLNKAEVYQNAERIYHPQ